MAPYAGFFVPFNDTTFTQEIWADIHTPLSEIVIPISYWTGTSWGPDISIDTTVITPPDLRGVTYGPAGNDPAWTIRTVAIDDSAKTIVLGFVSFGGFPANRSGDILCTLHFELKDFDQFAIVIDTITVGDAHLRIVDTNDISYVPNWTPGYITSLWDQVRESPILPGLRADLVATPNPFNAATRLEFDLNSPAHVQIEIVDALGRRVVTLLDANLQAGRQTVLWDGRGEGQKPAASGIYFAVLRDGVGPARSRALTLLK